MFFGLLGFRANSGFGFCDTIFWVQGSDVRFFDTILGFGMQGLGFLTRFQGLGFWFFHATSGFGVLFFSHQIRVLVKTHTFFHPKSNIFIKIVIIWHALALQHALEIIKSSVKYIISGYAWQKTPAKSRGGNRARGFDPRNEVNKKIIKIDVF